MDKHYLKLGRSLLWFYGYCMWLPRLISSDFPGIMWPLQTILCPYFQGPDIRDLSVWVIFS